VAGDAIVAFDLCLFKALVFAVDGALVRFLSDAFLSLIKSWLWPFLIDVCQNRVAEGKETPRHQPGRLRLPFFLR